MRRDFDFKMDEAEMEIKIPECDIPHPSEIFKRFLIRAKLQDEPANKIAKILGISRTAFYDFMNAKNGISPELAIRLARFFQDFDPVLYPKAASPEYWWDLNCHWIFIDWFKNPKNLNKKSNVGLVRYKLDCRNNISTIEDRYDLLVNNNITLTFKPSQDDSEIPF